ncbi:MAG: ABC transporter ATP-binding protein [Gammaproteobacteria bacterium]|nr:ABC transporter ATP-binding protein [Gammaproteobacteria bacterium]
MNNPYFSLIRTVWHYGLPWRKSIVGYYLAYVVAQFFWSLGPFAFGSAITVLQNFKPGRLHEVIFWLVASVAVLLVFWILHGPARVIERTIALKIQQAYRLHIYEKLTQLPLTWHQDHHSGNIITRLTRASTALRQFAENQFLYIETIVQFLVSIGFLLWLSVPVGILSLVASVFVTWIVILFDKKLIPLYDAENEVENHAGAVLFDYVSNMTTILTLRLGDLTHSNLMQRLIKIWPFFKKDAVLNETKWFTMMMLLSSVQAILLAGYIIHTVSVSGGIMIGVIVMIFRYQYDLSTVFHGLSMHYSELVRMNTDINSMQPILRDIEKLAHVTKGESIARQWHTISISDLTFSHTGKSKHKITFDRIGFQIKRGEKIALIGMSGGGKSTLLNILSGLYSPSHVQLMIDDVVFDVLEPLKAITTLVPQDPELFENTIAFNITLDLPATTDDMQTAIKLAGFQSVLEGMPLGLETDIREKGLNLSVGQKQRLALARGLFAARYSSLILMDEPTSSVDLPTEKEILSSVIEAFPETAMIVSLHRLHLLPKFDSVIMLKHGKIVALGSLPDLLEQPGPVSELWKTYRN